jgi:UDP-N-acetylmuramoyl-tripeptide--D-alanyl-D-alanine ligase
MSLVAAVVLGQLRWLRVAQRVQYLPGEVTRIERLWFSRRPLSLLWWALAIAAALLGYLSVPWSVPAAAWLVVVAPLIATLSPWRMPLMGVTKPVAWTGRLVRVAVVSTLLLAAVATVSIWFLGPAGALVPVILNALVMDLGLVVLWPVERALQKPYLSNAQEKLRRVDPQIVAITGSYGKTTAKGYTAQILGAKYQVMASPASFNNLMGLSRSINDTLAPGTEVFVAEMGMNQEGRIRELAQWFPPYISAITVIGEAHYERLGSHQAIFRAKAEITENASVVVLPVDQPELVQLAETCRARGTIDVPHDAALKQLNALPVAAHRSEVSYSERGVAIIDDTYNSNPPGALRAVAGAKALAEERGGSFYVVTPGMVELGALQRKRNRELGEAIREAGGTCYAVGLTNRHALVEGAGDEAQVFLTREEAVGAVLQVAGESDVILYENDLPDHYP